ncbi:BRCA1 C Terminus domain-containing protein [Rutstroemia sp. NJR-2017a BBW]|nr:BRCA1 C Terminus domain-containing protein [Rutstroemia sp. NJR-2017a BBW]
MIGQAQAKAAVLSTLKGPESMSWAQIPKGKNNSGFTAHISPHHAFDMSSRLAVDNTFHYQHYKVCCHLLRKSQERPLWFGVTTSKATGGNLRVVRSLISRRIRHAFVQALLKRGCDIHGKLLPDASKQNRENGDIRGTIYAHATEAALKMKMEDLEAQAHSVVGQLISKTEQLQQKRAFAGGPGQNFKKGYYKKDPRSQPQFAVSRNRNGGNNYVN